MDGMMDLKVEMLELALGEEQEGPWICWAWLQHPWGSTSEQEGQVELKVRGKTKTKPQILPGSFAVLLQEWELKGGNFLQHKKYLWYFSVTVEIQEDNIS